MFVVFGQTLVHRLSQMGHVGWINPVECARVVQRMNAAIRPRRDAEPKRMLARLEVIERAFKNALNAVGFRGRIHLNASVRLTGVGEVHHEPWKFEIRRVRHLEGRGGNGELISR